MSARLDGFAPIGDYGAIGDGRTTALVARDGSIDWLCLPAHDSGSVFGALLDPERGGSFQLGPVDTGFEVERRYLDGTAVLETTTHTDDGVIRVTDAVTTDGGRLLPWHELVRRVECLAGPVGLRWHVTPRFGFGTAPSEVALATPELCVATSRAGQLGILAWDAGEIAAGAEGVGAEIELGAGDRATLALVFTTDEPLPSPSRDEVEDRLERTASAWLEWLRAHDYEGVWREDVERSLLTLKLLTAPSGAVIAAPTTSLPERIGGDRNYDYRHAWPRDTSFTLDALLHCGLREPAHASFAWLLRALEDTHPRVQPIYRLSGEVLDHEIELPLAGYRGSRPVREGNDAAGQLQLGAYGDLLHTAWLYTEQGNRLDPSTGRRLGENADLLCEIWRNADSSIWELPDEQQFTVSKMGSWLALRRAGQLAERGHVPGRNAERWTRERSAIAAWVESECWSEERQSYLAYPGADKLDVACLLMGRMGYDEVAEGRFEATLEAIQAELQDGPFVYRCTGMDEIEGAFLACSFWVVEALARCERTDEACELMDDVLALGNDLGLFSEEVDPSTRELLGNHPQGLSHLSLINAAATIEDRLHGQRR
jgi:GH15 family glucan-1,4-alpha-glucosidase